MIQQLQKGATYHCQKCHKTFRYTGSNLSCLVIHSESSCCHYGDQEISSQEKIEEDKKKLKKVRHKHIWKYIDAGNERICEAPFPTIESCGQK